MTACDLIVVEQSVTFALTEVRIGVAAAKIAAAMLTGEVFSAAEAREMGLITHVTGDVSATVDDLISGILAGAPRAVAATKAMLHRVPTLDRQTGFGEMRALSEEFFSGPDAAEGMAAFIEKRLPAWNPAAT
jgi:enoyl-CoA hydratase/carnithine racemase